MQGHKATTFWFHCERFSVKSTKFYRRNFVVRVIFASVTRVWHASLFTDFVSKADPRCELTRLRQRRFQRR